MFSQAISNRVKPDSGWIVKALNDAINEAGPMPYPSIIADNLVENKIAVNNFLVQKYFLKREKFAAFDLENLIKGNLTGDSYIGACGCVLDQVKLFPDAAKQFCLPNISSVVYVKNLMEKLCAPYFF